MAMSEKPVIKSIMPAQGCLRQGWTARQGDDGGRSIDMHRPVLGLALLDDGTLDLIIEFSGEVRLRADAEAWVRSRPSLAPDSFGSGRSTQYDPRCECRGRTAEWKDLTAGEVADAFDLAGEAGEAGQ
jgi:hypothetical protein